MRVALIFLVLGFSFLEFFRCLLVFLVVFAEFLL